MKRYIAFVAALSLCMRLLCFFADGAAIADGGDIYIHVNDEHPASWYEGYITVSELKPVKAKIRFKPNENYPVYSGPGKDYLRGAEGKASVSTNSVFDVYGIVAGNSNNKFVYMLIQYKIDKYNYRFGFITDFAVRAEYCKNIPLIELDTYEGGGYIDIGTKITDDPLHSKRISDIAQITLTVVIRAFLGNEWALISYNPNNYYYETTWGFVKRSAIAPILPGY